MLESEYDIVALSIGDEHHLIADGVLSRSSVLQLEDDLEGLTECDVTVIGPKPVTVVIHRPCPERVIQEAKGLIFQQIKDD